MNNPIWLNDIAKKAGGTPFGEITFKLKRHRNMTTEMEAITYSRIKYDDNDAVFANLSQLMNDLIANEYTGKLQFELTYKNGAIEKASIKNTKIVNYRDKK